MKILNLIFILFLTVSLSAQQNVGIGTTTPNSKAALDVVSNDQGILIPRMTTIQRMAISPAANEKGLMVFDTDYNKLFTFDGSLWIENGEKLWSEDAFGINYGDKVGIGANSFSNSNLYIYRPTGQYGPGKSNIYAYRIGNNSNTSPYIGTGFSYTGIDASIKTYANWGNSYSSALAAYGYLDYNNSTILIARHMAGTVYSYLGYKDDSGKLYSGYFHGDVSMDSEVNIGSIDVPAGYKLAVDGKIIAEELKIQNSTAWPDYVFEKSYDMYSIAELKQFIDKNKHLPNIPKADIVEAEGISVGDMQVRMMEKIEELTLYVIQLQEEIEALKLANKNSKED